MSMLGWVTFSVLLVDIIGFYASCSVHLICLHYRFERDVFIARYIIAKRIAHVAQQLALDGIGACDQPIGHLHVINGFYPAMGIAYKKRFAGESGPVVADRVEGALLKYKGRSRSDI